MRQPNAADTRLPGDRRRRILTNGNFARAAHVTIYCHGRKTFARQAADGFRCFLCGHPVRVVT